MGQHGSSVAHGGAPGSTDAFLPESQLLDSPRTELETGRESFEETGEYAGGTGPGQPRPALRAPRRAAVGARRGPMPQDWSQGAHPDLHREPRSLHLRGRAGSGAPSPCSQLSPLLLPQPPASGSWMTRRRRTVSSSGPSSPARRRYGCPTWSARGSARCSQPGAAVLAACAQALGGPLAAQSCCPPGPPHHQRTPSAQRPRWPCLRPLTLPVCLPSPRLSGAGREEAVAGLRPHGLQAAAGGEVPARRQAGTTARGERAPGEAEGGGTAGRTLARRCSQQGRVGRASLFRRRPACRRGAPASDAGASVGTAVLLLQCILALAAAAPVSQPSCAVCLSPGASAKEVAQLPVPSDVPGQARRARHHCKEASTPEPGWAWASPQQGPDSSRRAPAASIQQAFPLLAAMRT